MVIFKSATYDQFHCIASACPDSCCHEWSVSVDPDAAAFYRALPGALGDRLRQVLAEEDGDTVITIENGRCPMWRDDGLCRIQAELGHDALCKTCREFPRITHDYGDFQQWQLELSCPEAARLIMGSPPLPAAESRIPGETAPEYDEEVMAILFPALEEARQILSRDLPIGRRLALLLMYGYHVQAQIDGGESAPFDSEVALEEARSFAKFGDAGDVLDFFKDLEILTDRWRARLEAHEGSPWDPRCGALAWYFVERYWLQAVSDYDLVSRAKLAVISCLAVKLLGGDLVETAQLYAKEIENDPDNIGALLDAAYTAPAFTDDKLLGQLLGMQNAEC